MDQNQLTLELQTLLQTVKDALGGDRASLHILAIAAPIDAADRLATLTLLYDLDRLVGLGSRSDHPALRSSLRRLRDRLESTSETAHSARPSTSLPKQYPGAGLQVSPNAWRELAGPTIDEQMEQGLPGSGAMTTPDEPSIKPKRVAS